MEFCLFQKTKQNTTATKNGVYLGRTPGNTSTKQIFSSPHSSTILAIQVTTTMEKAECMTCKRGTVSSCHKPPTQYTQASKYRKQEVSPQRHSFRHCETQGQNTGGWRIQWLWRVLSFKVSNQGQSVRLNLQKQYGQFVNIETITGTGKKQTGHREQLNIMPGSVSQKYLVNTRTIPQRNSQSIL